MVWVNGILFLFSLMKKLAAKNSALYKNGCAPFSPMQAKKSIPILWDNISTPQKNGDAELFLLPEDALQRGPWRGAEL